MRTILAIAIVAAAVAAAPAPAEAQRNPLYAGFGGGPYAYFDCCAIHGRLQGEFGWHFSGDDTGFVMAVEAVTTFGPHFLMFFGGLRLGGDIEVAGRHDWGVLLRPSGLFGFGLYDREGPDNAWGYFVLQPAFDIRFVFADRVVGDGRPDPAAVQSNALPPPGAAGLLAGVAARHGRARNTG